MHIVFIPYGKRSEVELLFRDMEAQKHYLKMQKGKEEKQIALQGQLRILPFGVYEYVCPKEDADIVLNTLGNVAKDRYVTDFKKTALRKALKLETIPEYKKDKFFLWIKDNVAIVLLGIKEDKEVVGTLELDKGWTHEAI